ncbi:hypothetical protein ACFW34_12205 [Streptomyces sp. NPDC058848]|uniref:hypothetical protein n=1 Tax=unclassified Streptomyces TaxID=2593676 RepID=UPI0036CF421E
MMERNTTMSPPVYVGLPLDPPTPVAGCEICARAAKAREAARRMGAMTNLSDANVVIRRHPHGDGRSA